MPDAFAVGADRLCQKSKGRLPHVVWAPEVDLGQKEAGHTVVLGAGVVGYESALSLTSKA